MFLDDDHQRCELNHQLKLKLNNMARWKRSELIQPRNNSRNTKEDTLVCGGSADKRVECLVNTLGCSRRIATKPQQTTNPPHLVLDFEGCRCHTASGSTDGNDHDWHCHTTKDAEPAQQPEAAVLHRSQDGKVVSSVDTALLRGHTERMIPVTCSIAW